MSHYPLYAELYEVNGAIYRRPPYRGDTTQTNQLPAGAGDTADLYDDDDHEDEKYTNDDGPVCGVDENSNAPPGFSSLKISDSLPSNGDPRVREIFGQFTGSIDVPCNLHGLIIGRAFAIKNEMEKATRCRITIPTKGSNLTTIRVDATHGAGAENVSRCLDRIEAIAISGQKAKWTKTHFVAVPCTIVGGHTASFVQRNFMNFQEMVMTIPEAHYGPSAYGGGSILESMKNPDLFPDSAKLHMTIAMLCLQSDQDKETARKTMAEIQEKYKNTKRMSMEITGLDIMNDDKEQVHVLFGKAKPDDAIQAFFDDVRHHFWKAGLMSKHEKEHEGVKMHMTVMNSRYAVPENTAGNYDAARDYKMRKTFNAKAIMERHPNFPFGFVDLDTLAICELGTTNMDNGFYECFMKEKVCIPVVDKFDYGTPPKWQPKKRSFE